MFSCKADTTKVPCGRTVALMPVTAILRHLRTSCAIQTEMQLREESREGTRDVAKLWSKAARRET